MPDVKLRFYCKLCNKTITLKISESFQEDLKQKANKWPYPLVYPHANHWAIIYVDTNFYERGVIETQAMMEEQK
jgi:hypothetical protein